MVVRRLSAAWLERIGLPKDQVQALLQAITPVIASAPSTYTWISNDAGATWGTTSPQSLVVNFRRGDNQIASATLTGVRTNGTGAIALTLTAHTGEPTTTTISFSGTPIASAVIVHDLSQARTSVLFQTLKDGTALGTFSGGGGGSSGGGGGGGGGPGK